MIGRASPVEGTVTRSWRSTGRPRAGRTTGLKDMMGLGGLTGILAAAPMRVWLPVCMVFFFLSGLN